MCIEELYDNLNDILYNFGNEFITIDNSRFKLILLENSIIIKESDNNSGMSIVNNIENVLNTCFTIYLSLNNKKENIDVFCLSKYDKTIDLIIKHKREKKNSGSFMIHDNYQWIEVIDNDKYMEMLTYIKNSRNISDKERFDKLKELKRRKSILDKSLSNLVESMNNLKKNRKLIEL